jgi:hypothetical protein
MQFTYSQRDFDLLPDDIFKQLALNMKIKTDDIEDIIDKLGFKTNNDGSETITIKTPYILVGTPNGLSRAIDDYPLDQADDILEENKIDSIKMDDFTMIAKASELHKGPIWLSDAEDDVLTIMKRSDFDPSTMHGLLALPIKMSKKKKKKKTLSKAELRALSNIVDPKPNLVPGSVKTRTLKAKEVDSITIVPSEDKPLIGKKKKELIDIVKNIRNTKCNKFKKLHKMKKADLIKLLMESS